MQSQKLCHRSCNCFSPPKSCCPILRYHFNFKSMWSTYFYAYRQLHTVQSTHTIYCRNSKSSFHIDYKEGKAFIACFFIPLHLLLAKPRVGCLSSWCHGASDSHELLKVCRSVSCSFLFRILLNYDTNLPWSGHVDVGGSLCCVVHFLYGWAQ